MYFTESTVGNHVFMLNMTGSPCSPLVTGFVFSHLQMEPAVFWAWCVREETLRRMVGGPWGPSPQLCRARELGLIPHGNSVRRPKTYFLRVFEKFRPPRKYGPMTKTVNSDKLHGVVVGDDANASLFCLLASETKILLAV
jgi:hypothetical protein